MDHVRFARFSEGTQGIIIVFAPLLVAQKRGYFAKHGIDVEVVEPQKHYGWLELVEGRADLGAGYFTFCAQPEYRGKIKAVAVLDEHRPGCGFTSLMARPELITSGELSDYASLKGKRIGLLPRRGDDFMAWHGVLSQAGLTLDDVTVLPIPHGGPVREEALRKKEVDVLICRRPRDQFEHAHDGSLLHWKRGFDVFPFQQAQFLLGATRFIEERGDVGARFFAGYLEGARDFVDAFVYGRDRQSMVDLLVEASDDTRTTIASMMPVYYTPNGSIDMHRLENDRQALVAHDLLPRDVPLEEIVDNSLTEAAVRTIGPYHDPRPN